MTEQSKINVPAKEIFAESRFPGSCQPYSHCNLNGKSNHKGLWSLLYEAVIPFVRTLLLSPEAPPKAPPPNTNTLGIRPQHMNLRRLYSVCSKS